MIVCQCQCQCACACCVCRWLFYLSLFCCLLHSLMLCYVYGAMFNDIAVSMRFSTFRAILLRRRRSRLISIYAIEHYFEIHHSFVCLKFSLQFSFIFRSPMLINTLSGPAVHINSDRCSTVLFLHCTRTQF